MRGMSMVTIKAKAFIPNTPKDPKAFSKDLELRYRRLSDSIRRDFEKTVSTWEKKPKFSVKRVRDSSGAIIFEASTDNEIYGYVTLGTPPHVIRAKNAPFLSFRYPFGAKTTPNLLTSKAGFIGDSWAKKQEVQHPGTEARNFHKLIAKRFQDKVVKESNEALRSYLKDKQKTR
jgi:hypothetical protein